MIRTSSSSVAIFSIEILIRSVLSRVRGGGQIGIDSIPREILTQFPIVLLEVKNLDESVDRMMQLGITPKNLVVWNSSRHIEPITFESEDDTIIFTEGLELHCHDKPELKKSIEILKYLQFMKIRYQISPDDYEEILGQFLHMATGIQMNWKNPRTIQEKIQWLKLYDSTPLKTLCADKFKVKNYITQKIGSEYVIPLLDVWENPDSIDLKSLPNQFVLKTNHGCDMNIIVKDKSRFDLESAKENLRTWLAIDYGMFAFEFHYSKIPRKIIAEEFIQALGADDTPDYKFYCFNGEPMFVQFESEMRTNWQLSLFDLNWKFMPFQRIDHKMHEKLPPAPKNLALMIELARKLSEDFSFVRVDFYEVEDKVLVGELTFTPTGGIMVYDPPEWNLKLGDILKLPAKGKPFNLFE